MCLDEKTSIALMRAMESIRAQLARRGEASMGDLERAFIECDEHGSGTVSYKTFKAVLESVGFNVDTCSPGSRKIFEEYDKCCDGIIDYMTFVQTLYGKMSLFRRNLVTTAWRKLSKCGEPVPIERVIHAYAAERHPEVAAADRYDKSLRQERVERHFERNFADGADGFVTEKKFMDVYTRISASYPHIENDFKFAEMMQKCWNLTDDEVRDARPRQERDIQPLLKTIRQKIKSTSAAAESGRVKLRLKLKHADLNDHGKLSHGQFRSAMLNFAIDSNQADDLFELFSRESLEGTGHYGANAREGYHSKPRGHMPIAGVFGGETRAWRYDGSYATPPVAKWLEYEDFANFVYKDHPTD